MAELLVISGIVASAFTAGAGIVGVVIWVRRLMANRKCLEVTSTPNHTYTQKDGSVIIGMHMELTNPARKTRSINLVRLRAEPPDTSVSLASIDWTEQGKAIIELDLPEGRARHVTPSEDVFKFPLSVPAESRIGGLIFVYLNPRHDLEIFKLSLDLLDGEHILGAVTLNLSAIYS